MGKLIILEGMDGSGTTTQSKMLVSYLEKMGHRVSASAEPTKSPLGQEIRKWLAKPLEQEPHLLAMLALCFAADRMHHVHFGLAPDLKTHDFVIVDRYVLSSLVYQGLHLPLSFVKEINHFALKPDLTLVLQVPAQLAYDRIVARSGNKDFYESKPLLERLEKRYLELAEQDPEHTVILDGTGSKEQVHQRLIDILGQRVSL